MQGIFTVAVYYNGIDPATHMYRSSMEFIVEADDNGGAISAARRQFRAVHTEPINSIHIIKPDSRFNHPAVGGGRHYLAGAA